MKLIAMINNSTVINIAIWEEGTEWNPGIEYELVDVTNRPEVQIGHIYNGKEFCLPE